jgi:hypothetical protein
VALNGTKMNLAELNEIRRLLGELYTDPQIIKKLNIPRRTYYRYKSRILKEDKKLLENRASDELAHRVKQVENSLEFAISINKQIAEKSDNDLAKIQATTMIIKAHMGLLKLLQNGPNHESVKIITKDVTDNTRVRSIQH